MNADYDRQFFVFSIGVHPRSSAANLGFSFFSNLFNLAASTSS
jgi:hypothetical protein